MDNTEFKKILQICTEKVGFKYCKKNYYYQNEEIIIVVNTQKSNYDDSFYINYGFLLRTIHDNLDYPNISDCDIIGRFVNNTNDTTEFDFQLPMLVSDKLMECLNSNINNIIIPVINEGIKKYFKLFPKALFTAKRDLKEYLEKEGFTYNLS